MAVCIDVESNRPITKDKAAVRHSRKIRTVRLLRWSLDMVTTARISIEGKGSQSCVVVSSALLVHASAYFQRYIFILLITVFVSSVAASYYLFASAEVHSYVHTLERETMVPALSLSNR